LHYSKEDITILTFLERKREMKCKKCGKKLREIDDKRLVSPLDKKKKSWWVCIQCYTKHYF